MHKTLYAIVIVVICFITISCAGNNSGNPIELDYERDLQDFLGNPEMLFGDYYDSTFPESVYCEVDIGGIDVLSPDDMYSGQPYSYDDWGTAVVTLMRDENDTEAPFKPVARWMTDDGIADLSEPFYVTAWDEDDPDNVIRYRHPKCIATYFETIGPGSIEYVELAVAYQIMGLSAGEIDEQIGENWDEETNNDEWDIGLTTLTWELEDFPDPDFVSRKDFFIPEYVNEEPAQMDDVDPDLAYDTYTGNIYLVFSDLNTPRAVHTAIPKYVRFERDLGDGSIELNGWHNSIGWSQGVPRDIRELYSTHGGWDPSIAIGKMDLFVGGLWVESTDPFIVISYTAQFDGQTGFNVNIASWQIDSFQNRGVFRVVHPLYENKNAGLSTVALTPNSSSRNYGALVFTQVTGEDQYGPVLTSFYVDSFNIWGLGEEDSFLELTNANYADNLYPSITLHETSAGSSPDDYTSNVIWMAQDAEMDSLHPTTSEVTTTVTWDDDPVELSAEMELSHTFTQYTENDDYTIWGNYNPAQIPFIVPGMATSIRSTSNNNYWAAWCNRIEMEPPADYVWGTFGVSD